MKSNRSIWVIHLILFICLTILGIVEGVHTIWIMVQCTRNPNDTSSSFKGRLHVLVVASIWTAILCPIFIFLLKVASVLITAIFLGLTWVLWLIGAVIITQYLRCDIDCTKTQYCHQLYHSLGFAWGAWFLTTLTCVTVAICAFRREERIREPLVCVPKGKPKCEEEQTD